jgi:hypothetical protein
MRRVGQRHDELRRCAHAIALGVPLALGYLKQDSPADDGWSYGSEGFNHFKEVLTACAEADAASRPLLTSHRREIRGAVDEIWVRMAAAEFRWETVGLLVTNAEVEAFPTGALTTAVFGKRAPRNASFEQYVKDGLPTEVIEAGPSPGPSSPSP